jgi:hypothetical protein
LLVAIFSGAPFAPGTSSIQQVFLNGTQMPFVTGLKTSIGVLPIDSDNDSADDRHENRDDGDDAEYLVLENTSTGPFFNGPGLVLRIVETDRPPTVLANCLTRPTAMTLDRREHTLYVTDLAGHVVAIPCRGNRLPHARAVADRRVPRPSLPRWRSSSIAAAGEADKSRCVCNWTNEGSRLL